MSRDFASVDWVHPTWRDLLIDELVRNQESRRKFLGKCQEQGIVLALSFAGGATGTRTFPLLMDDDDWRLLRARTQELLQKSDRASYTILRALDAVFSEGGNKRVLGQEASNWVGDLTRSALNALRRAHDESGAAIPLELLTLYYRLSLRVEPLPPSPDLRATWKNLFLNYCRQVAEEDSHAGAIVRVLDEIRRFEDLVASNEPRFLGAMDVDASLGEHVGELLDRCQWVRDGVEQDGSSFDEDDLETVGSLADHLERLAQRLPGFGPRLLDEYRELWSAVQNARELREDLWEAGRTAPVRRASLQADPPTTASFNLDRFFADL